MPIIEKSNFTPPFLFGYHHIQTMYPSLIRKLSGVNYKRERLELSDGDFVDIDWNLVNSKNLVIVLHGLEGDSTRPYTKGIIKTFGQNGWDGLGMNFRGCSGEPNRLLRSYHSGETEDLQQVIDHAVDRKGYEQIVLVGFSLGGNVVLKYMGENGEHLRPQVKGAVAFSVPCHLLSCGGELEKWHNWLYLNRFLVSLKAKVRQKMNLIDDRIDFKRAMNARTFLVFDDAVTAPLHGFDSGMDYYMKSSSLQYLSSIKRPTLLVTAKDDSFLSIESYPYDIARESDHFFFESPDHGGHVGFIQFNKKNEYYAEARAWEFVDQHIATK